MGRYSFFILSFCYRSHYVYADSSSSDVLLDSSSRADDSSSDSTIDSETGILDSSSSVQQEESTSTSISEESSEESVSDSLDTVNIEKINSLYRNFFDMFKGTISIFYDDENTFYEVPSFETFSMWTGATFKDVTVTGSEVGGIGSMKIGSAFSTWSWPTGTSQVVINHAILNAAKNSIYATNARIDGLFTNFDSINSRVNSISSTVSSHTSQISNAISRIALVETGLKNETGSRQDADKNLQSQISTNKANIEARYESALNNIILETESRQKADKNLQKQISDNHKTAIDNILLETGSRQDADKNLQSQISTNKANIEARYESALNNIILETKSRQDADKNLQSQISTNKANIEARYESALNNIILETKSRQDADKKLQSQISTNKANIEARYESALNNIILETKSRQDADINLQKQISTNKTNIEARYESALNNVILETGSRQNADINLQKQITSLKNTVDGFSFSDTAIIAAIVGLHDTWKSKDYTASILEDDGDAVKLMKSVANKIGSSVANNITLLRNVFGKDGTYWVEYDKRWNNFPLWLQGLLNNYFDNIYNLENKDSLLYRLTYTIIEQSTYIRDFVIEINDNLLIANDSLLLVVDWLKMLYNKPPYGVTVTTPGFDFDRLKHILDGLNFGNIVNEAGTNIWDFLTELIKQLGEVLGTAISGLTEVAEKILDLLGDLINQIIRLVVPENLDFLDTGFDSIKSKIDIKFGSFLNLGSQVKEVVQPIEQDFKSVVSIDIMGAKFEPDFTLIDWVVVRFRTVMSLSIWLSVAIYIYRKITGNGDLINDN